MSTFFCGVASLEGMSELVLVGHFSGGWGLGGPVFPAQIPPLPVLVDPQVNALPVSVAA